MGQKKGICDQIKTLQSNLKNAEESFRTHNGTRGELDLMLAEAQLRFLKEKRGSKVFWARQTFAVSIAFAIVLAGVSSWLWAKSTVPKAVVAVQQVAVIPEVRNVEMAADPLSKKKEFLANANIVAVSDNISEYKEKNNVEPVLEKPSVLTKQTNTSKAVVGTQELRDLVRVARKKLSEAN